MTFEKWLSYQITRNDPVGDLARDFRDSKKQDFYIERIRPKCDEETLERWEACKGAFKALKRAKKEYNLFMKTAF